MVRSGRFFAKKGRMARAASLFLLFLCHDDAQERAAAGGMRGKSVWACAAPYDDVSVKMVEVCALRYGIGEGAVRKNPRSSNLGTARSQSAVRLGKSGDKGWACLQFC